MIYLDHAASSTMDYDACRVLMDAQRALGNPNSRHSLGEVAAHRIERAKNQIASLIGAHPDEIYFTSGGTESNFLFHCLTNDFDVMTTAGEHESNYVRTEGYYRKTAMDPSTGRVYADRITATLDDEDVWYSNAALVSMIWVSNETGSVNDLAPVAHFCQEHGYIFHVDGTQAVGHIPVDVKKEKISAMTFSAHKFGGPQGLGMLYISKGVMEYLSYNNSFAEYLLRPKTLPVALIAAAGEAARKAQQTLLANRIGWANLRKVFLQKLSGGGLVYQVNGGDTFSNIISLTIPGVHGERLMLELDLDGIYVSTGAACSSGDGKPSQTLMEMGLSEEEARSTIRISMGPETSLSDMMETAKAILRRAERIKKESANASES